MNITNIFPQVIIMVSTMFSGHTLACSYAIDEAKQKADLVEKAVGYLQLQEDQIQSTRVQGYRAYESIPTPMCPEEITIEGVVLVRYQDNLPTFPVNCVSSVRVKKISQRIDSQKLTYELELVSSNCENIAD